MNELAGWLAEDQVAKDFFAGYDMSEEVEYSSFLSLDPVLAGLHKRLQDAKAQYAKLAKKHGKLDPMTEIVAETMESLKVSVDTRLIELRRNKKFIRMAQHYTAKDNTPDYARHLFNASKRHVAKQERYNAQLRKQAAYKAQKAGEDGFFFMMILLWLMEQTLEFTRRQFSLASAFSFAAHEEVLGRATAKGGSRG